MRGHHFVRILFASLVLTLISVSFVAATDKASNEQVIEIRDTRSGSGPCGFVVHRDLEGTVNITSGIDDAGRLVLKIGRVEMQGLLTNPANGQSVDIRWVQPNGAVGLATSVVSTDVMLGLTGWLFRGYDTADAQLTMDLPADGTEVLVFTAGEHSEDPWTHVCALLA